MQRVPRQFVGKVGWWILAAALLLAQPDFALPQDEDSKAAAIVLRDRGDARREAGELEAAMTLYKEAADLAPSNLGIHYRIAKLALDMSQRQSGLNAIEAMMRLDGSLEADEELLQLRRDLQSLPDANEAEKNRTGGLSSKDRLAIRSAELAIDEALSIPPEEDVQRRAKLAKEARDHLSGLLADPFQESIDVWRLAGVIAVIQEEDDLAAFALEAIERLEPDYANDERLLTLAAELNRQADRERMEEIAHQRSRTQQIYKAALGSDDPEAMYNLALGYDYGRGVPEDDVKAVEWYEKAANAGIAMAMLNLSVRYSDGEGVPQDHVKAFEWLTSAANARDATVTFGGMYDWLSSAATVEWLTSAANAGDAKAMRTLGATFDILGDAKAVEWWRKAANAGDASAMNNLGEMYADGRGVPEDDVKAVEWLEKAANAGHAGAMYHLGWMYRRGEGVPRNDDKAVEWWRKAANAGDSAAMNNLAFTYDYPVEWLRNAANAGDATAMYTLGHMYHEGLNVTEDDVKAVEWYEKAANAGYAEAMFKLGWMYVRGQGVSRDDAKAVEEFRRAARLGSERAQEELRRRNLDW